MLRSVNKPRLEPVAWVLILVAIIGHSDAIMHMMRVNGHFSIGLLEAMSLLGWTLAVLACLISIESKIACSARILMAERGSGRGTSTGAGQQLCEATGPGWELTAHILLSMGAAALLFAAAVTAMLLVFLDRRLRMRRIADLPSVLPPLDALEKVMFRLIGGGLRLADPRAVHRLRLRHQSIHSESGPKDGAVPDRVDNIRRTADRAHPLRLARALRGADGP